MSNEVHLKGKLAQKAAVQLAIASTQLKNKALQAIANGLRAKSLEIEKANARDMEEGRKNGLKESLFDRLLLIEQRINVIADAVEQIITLPDPIGTVISGSARPNGLRINKIRVPLGVIGMIYEARPNVTVDAAALCLKSGNAVILRGGKEAFYSNIKLVEIMSEAVKSVGLHESTIQLIESVDRAVAQDMMRANGLIDVLIPRGGAGLIQSVVQNATVPVIETGVGNCHVYIDETADPELAVSIAVNAKTNRPSVCNAAESMLVHASREKDLMPENSSGNGRKGVEIRGCERTCAIFPEAKPAVESDWGEEFLSPDTCSESRPSIDDAIEHIRTYSSKHTEAIVTKDVESADKFLAEIDSAALFVNASTRFTDGFEFGFGAEIGISTQKLHARGPMGLEELTSCKYVVRGNGQIK